ncbi:hypothetical protein [Dactylosporangium sp. NPDC051484]|uniref:hypothetical protein n=1 Tax=Dactylosporangium sp. NPDC051484 TaxID=3154942 RepID=UPI0034505F2E
MRLGRLSVAAVPPVIRAVDWTPLAAASVTTIALALLTTPGQPIQVQNLTVTARMCGVLLGVAAGFAVVDTADEISAVTPAPRWLRQSIRALGAFAVAAAVWAVAVSVMVARAVTDVDLGIGGLIVEAAFWIITGLSCAACAVRFQPVRMAAVAGAAVTLGLAVSTVFDRERFWPLPQDDQWQAAHVIWGVGLVVVTTVLLLTNREVRR